MTVPIPPPPRPIASSSARSEVMAVPPPFLLIPQPGSRLEALLAQRDIALARAKEAQAQADAIVDGIKAEATSAAPRGTQVIEIPAGPAWEALRMNWERPWRVDATRLRKEDPVTYVRWAVQSPGYWTLSKANRGRS